jgi:hypothetical protein
MANIQVTTNTSTDSDERSESCIAINPNNSTQMVSASKRFRNRYTYDTTVQTQWSDTSGQHWTESAQISDATDTAGVAYPVAADPSLAWSVAHDGTPLVYLITIPMKFPATGFSLDTLGIAVYTSVDFGKTWSAAQVIHPDPGDDKPWAAADANPNSPHRGRVYVVWNNNANILFARTIDYGKTWIGTGPSTHPHSASLAGSIIGQGGVAPEINVDRNGDIYVVWSTSSEIQMVVSRDGGDSFPPTAPPATGVIPLNNNVQYLVLHGYALLHDYAHFPGATFRLTVLPLPTACVAQGQVVVAWEDFREGVLRIYYALSTDGGTTWNATGPSGKPLLTGPIPHTFQHFHPQLAVARDGTVGCAFYEFGPKPSPTPPHPITPLIDVILARSFDSGATFFPVTVTDQPWDPITDAPWSDHPDDLTAPDDSLTFIGEYFGLDASDQDAFYPLWTDTRKGYQQLWTVGVPDKRWFFDKSTALDHAVLGKPYYPDYLFKQLGYESMRPWQVGDPPDWPLLVGQIDERLTAIERAMTVQDARTQALESGLGLQANLLSAVQQQLGRAFIRPEERPPVGEQVTQAPRRGLLARLFRRGR